MNMQVFPSKILLFGEYSILLGSKALAMPYPHYSGKLELFDMSGSAEETKISSLKELQLFYDYLHNNLNNSELAGKFDIERFKSELSSGICFQSDIPQGCGLGSSGAVTAAIYQRYSANTDRNNTTNLPEIRNHLSYLESFFHKKSSGTDPLVSYCNQPILLHNECIEPVKIPELFSFNLIDSQINRATGNLVETFLGQYDTNTSFSYILYELGEINNRCINAMLNGDTEAFFKHLKDLSIFQYNHLKKLIPASISTIWKEGFETDKYYVKLCGAGGGGYFLRINTSV